MQEENVTNNNHTLLFLLSVPLATSCPVISRCRMKTDSRAIKSNQDLRWETPVTSLFLNDFWGTPLSHSGSHKSYRPLCVLSFRLNFLLHQLNPWGYHLVNVFLHSLVTILFTSLASQIFRETRVTIIAALLFATHPIHTEAVAAIVGRADLGAALFFLLSLLSYMDFCHKSQEHKSKGRTSLYMCLVFAACSMLTKETGLSKSPKDHPFLHFVYFMSGNQR